MSSDVHVAAQVRNTLQQYRRSGYDFLEMSAGPSKEPAKLSRFADTIRELDEMRVAGTLSLEGYSVAVKQVLLLQQQPEVTVTIFVQLQLGVLDKEDLTTKMGRLRGLGRTRKNRGPYSKNDEEPLPRRRKKRKEAILVDIGAFAPAMTM